MKKIIMTLNNFKNKKILVIGDIMLDKFSWGKVERINPEQPAAQLVKVVKETFSLGGAANVANNISSLGAKCCLYGVVGKDSSGEKIKKLCKEKGIKLEEFHNDAETIVKQRIIAHGQQITRLDIGETNLKKINKDIQDQILNSLKKIIKDYDFMILSDYDKFIFNPELSKKIINLANSHKIPTLVDPKPRNLNFFKNCTLICPNRSEAEIMTNVKYSKETLIKMGKILITKTKVKDVIITCGEDGVFHYNGKGCNSILIPTQAKEIADVTGAGDTFAAILTLGLSCDLETKEALKLANYTAGMVVGKVGTAILTIDEIKKRLKEEIKKVEEILNEKG